MGKHRRPSAAEIRAQLFISRKAGKSVLCWTPGLRGNESAGAGAEQAMLHQNLREL